MTLTSIIMFNIVLDIVAIALMSAIMSLASRLTPHDEADAGARRHSGLAATPVHAPSRRAPQLRPGGERSAA